MRRLTETSPSAWRFPDIFPLGVISVDADVQKKSPIMRVWDALKNSVATFHVSQGFMGM
jgi:hypothetical protein